METEISVYKLEEHLYRKIVSGDRSTIFLLGGAGIGKSETVRRLAKRLAEWRGKELVEYTDRIGKKVLKEPEKYFVFRDLRLTEVEPSDLIGIPRDEGEYVIYKPLLWARVLSVCEGILFLDEITNVQRMDVQSAMYKLLLEKKVGDEQLHDGVIVVCAGNLPKHSTVAVKLPAPAVNRCNVYRVKPAEVDEWAQYMDATYGNKWNRVVYAFLKAHSEMFIVESEPETLEQFATPRRWTDLAVNCNGEISDIEVVAKVGRVAGSMFLNFIRTQTISLDELASKPELWALQTVDAKYLLLLRLVSSIRGGDSIDKYKKLLQYMVSKDKESLSVFLSVMDMDTRRKFMSVVVKDADLLDILLYVRKIKGIDVSVGGVV